LIHSEAAAMSSVYKRDNLNNFVHGHSSSSSKMEYNTAESRYLSQAFIAGVDDGIMSLKEAPVSPSPQCHGLALGSSELAQPGRTLLSWLLPDGPV
ncbi:Hypothetical predicted protein, partial [Podarcis lilfordi]